MKDFNSVDEILDFAIENEQNAVDFYTELASTARTEAIEKVFIEFAKDEMIHKSKIMEVKEKGIYTRPSGTVIDLKISDYMVNIKPTPDMTYQDALILAMHREKSAYKLYSALSDKAPNTDLRNLFLRLAQEESKHKLRFEVEYDEYVMREN